MSFLVLFESSDLFLYFFNRIAIGSSEGFGSLIHCKFLILEGTLNNVSDVGAEIFEFLFVDHVIY